MLTMLVVLFDRKRLDSNQYQRNNTRFGFSSSLFVDYCCFFSFVMATLLWWSNAFQDFMTVQLVTDETDFPENRVVPYQGTCKKLYLLLWKTEMRIHTIQHHRNIEGWDSWRRSDVVPTWDSMCPQFSTTGDKESGLSPTEKQYFGFSTQ